MIWQAIEYAYRKVLNVLMSPASDLSLASLLCALGIAMIVVRRGRRPGRHKVPTSALLQTLLPKKMFWSASTRADVGLLLFNMLVIGALIGWAMLSAHAVAAVMTNGLLALFGQLSQPDLPTYVPIAIRTLALFLAYELGYWVYHYLNHAVPFLWELHKVHHSAEVLTPLTNSRMHPLDGMLFANVLAIFMGLTDGLLNYMLATGVPQFTIANSNALIVLFTFTIAHLHHSHVWLAFTGLWGRILISPAHHQIHHSTDPRHFNKNLGSCLAIYDWLFGTLYVPSKAREKLTFGVDELGARAHTIQETLIAPMPRALGHCRAALVTAKARILRLSIRTSPGTATASPREVGS